MLEAQRTSHPMKAGRELQGGGPCQGTWLFLADALLVMLKMLESSLHPRKLNINTVFPKMQKFNTMKIRTFTMYIVAVPFA